MISCLLSCSSICVMLMRLMRCRIHGTDAAGGVRAAGLPARAAEEGPAEVHGGCAGMGGAGSRGGVPLDEEAHWQDERRAEDEDVEAERSALQTGEVWIPTSHKWW